MGQQFADQPGNALAHIGNFAQIALGKDGQDRLPQLANSIGGVLKSQNAKAVGLQNLQHIAH